jgi:hypothetical protein
MDCGIKSVNATSDIAEFELQIRALAGAAPWPFLCEGLPFDCDIFVVGINPARDVPLWPYWSVDAGVNKRAWLQAYLKRYGKYTSTRQRIERLVVATAPARVLETNVFHHQSHRQSALTRELQSTEVFDFLIATLKPEMVFVHGQPAVRHLQRLTSVVFDRDKFKTVHYAGTTFDVLTGDHLYNWSYVRIEQLGSVLRKRWATHRATGALDAPPP